MRRNDIQLRLFMAGFCLAVLCIVASPFAIGYWVKAAACADRWEGSGMASRFGVFSGCLVQTPSGRWIPDDRVRDADLAAPVRADR